MTKVQDYIMQMESVHEKLRHYYCGLVENYCALDLADSHFECELTSGDEEVFWQRMWEALLGCHFADIGYEVSSTDEGPDFLLVREDLKVWVEAICPRPKNIPEDFLAPVSAGEFKVYSVPFDELVLNWTAAIKEKMEKLEGYVKKRIVPANEPYLIAVNSGRLGHSGAGVSQLPFAAEIGFGLGPLAIKIDDEGKFGDPEHTFRTKIKNANGSFVSTAIFADPKYAGISAVLSTWTLCPQPDAIPFDIVYNPFTRARLPIGLLGPATEYDSRIEGDELVVKQFS